MSLEKKKEMKILELRKRNVNCAECGNELPYLDRVNKTDGRYYHLKCAKEKRHQVKIKHLHGGAVWWIKSNIKSIGFNR